MSTPELPLPRPCPYQPPGYDGPVSRAVLRNGQPVWLVTGHREARALLSDRRVSVDALHPNHPELARPKGTPRPDPVVRRAGLTFVEMDDPEHAAHRRMVLPYFTVRRARRLLPHIASTVDELLSALVAAGPPADLVTGFAVPLPALTLCEVFGVPARDRAFFREHAVRPVLSKQDATPAFRALNQYLERLLAVKREKPADDLLSGLGRRVDDGELTERQALNMCRMLLIAGHETTANTLALAVLTLLAHPEQLAVLRENPATTPGAVNELLRYLAVADLVPRIATAEIELGGQVIAAGDGIMLSLATANRDDAAFPDADRFEIRRRATHHLAFSHGVHQCLGHALARAELEIALTAVFRRLPGLRLAVPADAVPGKPALGLQGVDRLPVTWEETADAG